MARFGPFEFNLKTGELWNGGVRIKLPDQSAEILAALLGRPGELVTRDELCKRLWPAETFVDFEHGLNNATNRLREALRDSAEVSRFIQTLPRRGYRFIAPVEIASPATQAEPGYPSSGQELSSPAAPTTIAQIPQAGPGGSSARKLWLGAAACTTLIVLLVGTNVRRWRDHLLGSSRPARIQSIAVLPLENLTGDPSQEYFADGITDALTTSLAPMRGIRVISRTSAMHYVRTKRVLPEIARELGVDAVVEGSASRSHGVAHVNARLVYAPGDSQIWARSYEGADSGLTTMGLAIAKDIAHQIGAATPLESGDHFIRAPSVNPEAYDLYLRAEPYYGLQTREANDEAIRLLEKSVERDPQFAAAYAALATAYRTRAFSIELNEPRWTEKASAAVEKALALNPDLAEGYVSRGYLLWSRANGWSVERAVSDYRRALELNPNLAEAHHQLANVYNHVGLLDKAEEEIKKAIALDPLNSGIRFRVGINLLYQAKYDESLAELSDSEKFLPSFWAFQTAFVLQHLGRREEAQERVDAFLKTNPSDTGGSLTAMQALLAAEAGDAPLAERKIREAIAKGKGYQHFHHVAYAVASAYALLGRRDQAVQYLRMAADDGFPCYPLFEHDSNLDALRNDPRFLSFLAVQEKQWEYFREHL